MTAQKSEVDNLKLDAGESPSVALGFLALLLVLFLLPMLYDLTELLVRSRLSGA